MNGLMTISQFSYPTSIYFGEGASKKIPEHFRALGLKRPLVVTDRDLGALPVFETFMKGLKAGGLEPHAYLGIFGNPVRSQVHSGVDAYRQNHADSLIAIGGGAAMDCGKVIAMLITNPGDLFEYEWSKKPIQNALPYIVAVPTTAGTGSEIGRASLVSDDQTHQKKIFFDQKLLPRAVYADPELTLGLPALPTAATGMDALTHLMEAFVAKGYHPMADGIALEGIRKVAKYLAPAVSFARTKIGATPEHLEARKEMLAAAMMGAAAFQKGLGITHSCANALTTYYDRLHHGLANGVMLPYVLEWNASAAPEATQRMAEAVGMRDTKGLVQWVRDLKKQIGIPEQFQDLHADEARIQKLAEHALADGCTSENPRETSLEDFKQLFKKAISS